MLKNNQTYFKNLAVFTPQDFESMFGHFSTLVNKGLSANPTKWSNKLKQLFEYFVGLALKGLTFGFLMISGVMEVN